MRFNFRILLKYNVRKIDSQYQYRLTFSTTTSLFTVILDEITVSAIPSPIATMFCIFRIIRTLTYNKSYILITEQIQTPNLVYGIF